MNGKTMDERVTDLEKLAESLAPLPARMEAVEGRLVALSFLPYAERWPISDRNCATTLPPREWS